jgi:homoserine O-acetyltransferase
MSTARPAESSPSAARGVPRTPGGLGLVRTSRAVLFTPEAPLELERGAVLAPVEVAYETYGTLDATASNVVVVPHALTGDAHAAGHHGDPARRGWWDVLIGPGRPIDTDRWFVVASNLLGGCRGTTGPSSPDPATGRPYGLDFPALTIGDLVRVQRALLRHLGVRRIHAVVGGSLGGMQALEWVLQAPEDVDRVVVIAASARLSAQSIALSTAAREAILRDPDFQGGRYHGTGRRPDAGLAAARMIGHVTYVSEEALERKFDRARRAPGGALPASGAEWLAPDFEVEHYLHHQAATFLDRFDPLSYLYLTRVMDHFDPFRDPARLAAAAAAGAHATVVSFDSDWRFGPPHSDRIARELAAAGVGVVRRSLTSPWGHDSFLLALPDYLAVVAAALEP